ncbi:MAG TPA: hypothetical protein VJ249_00540 [Candidatus Bathyarchaeia archaeon]|nr:hypothetical protein [Candidatus Bathyarchaeia archaeon]
MRQGIFVKGLVPLLIGAVLIVCGVLTGRSETSVVSENAFDGSSPYGFLGNHEYKATAYLLPGAYELRYNFSSTEAISEFYVSIFDPDGYEVKSIYGPPASYEYQNANLTFETQKTGQHTLILGGRWMSAQVDLHRLLQSAKVVYPFEIVFYLGVPLFVGGFTVSISGILMKNKPTHWLDKL